MTPDEMPTDFGSVDIRWPSASDTLHGTGTNPASTVSLKWAQSQEAIRAIAFKEAA